MPEPPLPYLSSERLTRWAYLAFAVSTLYVVERAKNNNIPREVSTDRLHEQPRNLSNSFDVSRRTSLAWRHHYCPQSSHTRWQSCTRV